MIESRSILREHTLVEDGDEIRTFSLSCGCVSVTRQGRISEIRYCPRHQTMHGTMSGGASQGLKV
jgi:hypothetical protein